MSVLFGLFGALFFLVGVGGFLIAGTVMGQICGLISILIGFVAMGTSSMLDAVKVMIEKMPVPAIGVAADKVTTKAEWDN